MLLLIVLRICRNAVKLRVKNRNFGLHRGGKLKTKNKMKKIILMVIPALICVMLLTNCDSDKEQTTEEIKINETIKNTDTYYYETSAGGDEEGATIKVQAAHYEKSELIRDESTNFVVRYHYKPIVDFVGKDYVVIVVHKNKTGVGPIEKQTVKINFTITK